MTFCEYCQEEKTLHETVKFSGVKRPFCSEGIPLWSDSFLFIQKLFFCFIMSFLPYHLLGCKLLFKQDFIKRLGLKCVSCNHCNQLCKKGVTRQFGGMTRDFCGETCAKKFHDWYYKVWSVHQFKKTSWKLHVYWISSYECSETTLVATRQQGVIVVRYRVTWQSLWCGGKRWSISVTKVVCWSSTASRMSPSWSHRKAQRTAA